MGAGSSQSSIATPKASRSFSAIERPGFLSPYKILATFPGSSPSAAATCAWRSPRARISAQNTGSAAEALCPKCVRRRASSIHQALRTKVYVVKRQRSPGVNVGLPFVSMSASRVEPGSPFGERILQAISSMEGRSVNNVEAALGMSKGHLGRIIRGERASQNVDIDRVTRMAKLLHVNVLWLLTGEGPVRKDGRPTTPAEEAIVFARRNGAREDAIQTAWERNKEREPTMSATDWIIAIDTEARHLERQGVPRPEVVAEKQEAVRRGKARLERAKKKAASAVESEENNEGKESLVRRAGNHP